ncbi:MAG: hypothetical protein ABJC66_04310 [Gammaproteobacteria bacterium]
MTSGLLCLSTNLKSSEWAAWVQAIGSIVAVGAAWKAISHQIALARKARLNGILAIAEAAFTHAHRIDEIFSSGDTLSRSGTLYSEYDETIPNGIVRALNGVPIHEVGSRDAVIALLSLEDQVGFMRDAIKRYEKPEADPQTAKSLLHCTLDQFEQSLKDARPTLANNVRRHAAKIESDYEILKQSLKD